MGGACQVQNHSQDPKFHNTYGKRNGRDQVATGAFQAIEVGPPQLGDRNAEGTGETAGSDDKLVVQASAPHVSHVVIPRRGGLAAVSFKIESRPRSQVLKICFQDPFCAQASLLVAPTLGSSRPLPPAVLVPLVLGSRGLGFAAIGPRQVLQKVHQKAHAWAQTEPPTGSAWRLHRGTHKLALHYWHSPLCLSRRAAVRRT